MAESEIIDGKQQTQTGDADSLKKARRERERDLSGAESEQSEMRSV